MRTLMRYRVTSGLSRVLPYPAALRLADGCADLQWRMAGPVRRAVCGNLALATGRPLDEHAEGVRDVFRNFGRYLVEFFTMDRESVSRIRVVGERHLRDAHRRGLGTIILTAHLGNWELGAVALARMGFAVRAIALPHEDARTNRLFDAQRQRCGVHVIARGPQAVRQALAHLRAGGLLGVLGDREFGANGLCLPSWGRELIWPKGPAVLSRRGGAPVVPTFLLREGQGCFRLELAEPIWPRGDSVEALTSRYAAVIRRYIEQVPEQWLMFQPVQTAQAQTLRPASRARP